MLRAIQEQNDSRGIEKQGNGKGQGEKYPFASKKDNHVPSFWPRHPVAAHAPGNHVVKIIIELPFDRQKAVQNPEVKMLEPMKLPAFLMGREPPEKTDVYIVIMARDIGIRVVDDIVLACPNIGTAAEEIQRHGHEAVDPRAVGIGPVPPIVLNVETDSGHRQAQKDCSG
jgi:hypothetical protein